jgi:hypothetical protein
MAVTRGEITRVLLAENDDVLSRLIALYWVAQTPAYELGGYADGIREALLEERWGDATIL